MLQFFHVFIFKKNIIIFIFLLGIFEINLRIRFIIKYTYKNFYSLFINYKIYILIIDSFSSKLYYIFEFWFWISCKIQNEKFNIAVINIVKLIFAKNWWFFNFGYCNFFFEVFIYVFFYILLFHAFNRVHTIF